MGRRGRPPYPDILTPREWEVLAALRQNLTNEAIAARLGVTHAAAKYHVSEILSKLGVASREEAAAWEPEAAEARAPRLWRWWLGLVGWLRPVTLGKAALVGASLVVLAGMGVLAWGVLRTSDEDATQAASTTHTVAPSISPLSPSLPGSLPTPTPFYLTQKTGVSTDEIYITDRDGTQARLLTGGFNPEWSPVGDRIAYVGSWTGPGLGGVNWVHLIDVDDGDSREIGAYSWSDVGLNCAAYGPGTWSSDGGRFAIWPSGDGPEVEGGIVDVENGKRVNWSGCDSDWLADGRIVYAGACDSRSEYSCIRIWDGVTGSQLTIGERPALSPDGNELAFFRDRSLHIRMMSSGEERLLANVEVQGPDQPDWSPNGSQIVFSGGEILTVDVDTAATTTLGRGIFPRWSPDGARIAFYDFEEQACGGLLRVVDARSGEQVFAIPGASYDFSWSPDGNEIAYSVSVHREPGDCPVPTPPVS